MYRRRHALLTICALLGLVFSDAGAARGQFPSSDPLLECHSFARAPYLCDAIGGCDRDLKLARIRMDGAFRCLQRWLDCDLLNRTGSPAADNCPDRAEARCGREQLREDSYVSGSAPSQRTRFLEHCTPLDFDEEFLGAPPLGLGVGADESMCIAVDAPLASIGDYTTCGDIQQTRAHAKILSVIAPRSRELLEDNGWCSLFPEEGSAPEICNTGLAPRPAIAGNPVALSNHFRRCQKRIYRAYRTILNRHLNLLENCTESYLSCNLKDAHGDISASALATCLGRAASTCARQEARRDAKIPRMIETIGRACGTLTFGDLTDLMGYADIAASCNASSTAELAACGADRLRCLAWDVARFAEPRILADTPAEYLADYLSCSN